MAKLYDVDVSQLSKEEIRLILLKIDDRWHGKWFYVESQSIFRFEDEFDYRDLVQLMANNKTLLLLLIR